MYLFRFYRFLTWLFYYYTQCDKIVDVSFDFNYEEKVKQKKGNLPRIKKLEGNPKRPLCKVALTRNRIFWRLTDYVTKRGRKFPRRATRERERNKKKKRWKEETIRYDPSRRVFARVKYLRAESCSNTHVGLSFSVWYNISVRICAPRAMPKARSSPRFGACESARVSFTRLCTHALLPMYTHISRVVTRPSLPQNFFA